MSNPVIRKIVERYRHVVAEAHPGTTTWPVLSGHNVKPARYGDALVVVLEHTGYSGMSQASALLQLTKEQVGVDQLDSATKSRARAKLEVLFATRPTDMLLIFPNAFQPGDQLSIGLKDVDYELRVALAVHEQAMGLRPMKIFLSHKGADKPRVRGYFETLRLLGFDPWLDEDAMPAGTPLHREILQGFEDSCAAVFFITPNFRDEKFLEKEIDYALQQENEKGTTRFRIVTLVFAEGGAKPIVPKPLTRHVYKEPLDDLEGLRELLRALPVCVGPVRWT